MGSRISNYSDEEFAVIVKNSKSCADCMRTMGYKCTTGNASVATKRRIDELKLDTSHWFAHETDTAHRANEIPCEEYFVKGDINYD